MTIDIERSFLGLSTLRAPTVARLDGRCLQVCLIQSVSQPNRQTDHGSHSFSAAQPFDHCSVPPHVIDLPLAWIDRFTSDLVLPLVIHCRLSGSPPCRTIEPHPSACGITGTDSTSSLGNLSLYLRKLTRRVAGGIPQERRDV